MFTWERWRWVERLRRGRSPTAPIDPAGEHVARSAVADASSASFINAMLGALLDPALMLDQDGGISALNDGAKALFNVTERSAITKVTRSPELLSAIDKARETLEPQTFEARIAVPIERLLRGRVTPLSTAPQTGDAHAFLLVLRDLTEQDRLARLRVDFVANASHELRTPLASLKGFIETLQGSAKDDSAARERFLPIMQLQADRMSRLIKDLLSLSAIEMREHVSPRGAVDLAVLVPEVVDASRTLAEAKGIAITITPSPPDMLVVADRDELLQVMHNLIQNAINYGRPGGKVALGLSDRGARIALAVADDGIGIAPRHLPRLTERFYRVSAKDSRERGGTGLGLAIVKHIVNRHHGELQVTSELGKGSTFTVLLPRGS
jgi:two-component system, OmpR family, phosphate regulon sensor histidine kinase PhoR